jgi:hypothetical protein
LRYAPNLDGLREFDCAWPLLRARFALELEILAGRSGVDRCR